MKNEESGAIFSECRTWRYQLWRIWDTDLPMLNVTALNPSTADETKNDPTVRRCINFAKSLGYGGLYVTNIFAFRATLPADMKKAEDPVGPENDYWLAKTAEMSGMTVAAWGVHGNFLNRAAHVEKIIKDLYVFRLTRKTRVPEHPLYLPGNLEPISLVEARTS